MNRAVATIATNCWIEYTSPTMWRLQGTEGLTIIASITKYYRVHPQRFDDHPEMLNSSIRRRLPQFMLVLFLALFADANSTLAQSPPDAAQRQGPPVVRSIDVQYYGPVTISRSRVLAQMRTKIGQPYSDVVAEEDIRSIYKTGSVQNVRVFGEPEGDGIRVIVAIQTRSMMNEIQIDGATQISPKRLRKNLGVKLNTPVKEEDLEKGRQKIVDIYQAHGFNDVDVQFRVEPIDEKRGTSRVIYTVDEGIKGAITLVRFEGNAHFPAKVLRKQMKTKKKTIISFIDKSGRQMRIAFETHERSEEHTSEL